MSPLPSQPPSPNMSCNSGGSEHFYNAHLAWRTLQMFAGAEGRVLNELLLFIPSSDGISLNINHPCNGLALTMDIHRSFGDLSFYLEPRVSFLAKAILIEKYPGEANNTEYTVRVIRPDNVQRDLKCVNGRKIGFKLIEEQPGEEKIPSPSPYILSLHAAITQVAKAIAGREHRCLDNLFDDYDDGFCLGLSDFVDSKSSFRLDWNLGRLQAEQQLREAKGKHDGLWYHGLHKSGKLY